MTIPILSNYFFAWDKLQHEMKEDEDCHWRVGAESEKDTQSLIDKDTQQREGGLLTEAGSLNTLARTPILCLPLTTLIGVSNQEFFCLVFMRP